MSEESESPVTRVTCTRSGRQSRPPSRMNLHTTKKQFGSDTLPAYTGNQNTQEVPPRIRANVLNEQRNVTLQCYKLVTSMKIGNFGQMMVKIASNNDVLNDTIQELYPGILAAKANDEDNPSWYSAMN
jgi:hypothetical protein